MKWPPCSDATRRSTSSRPAPGTAGCRPTSWAPLATGRRRSTERSGFTWWNDPPPRGRRNRPCSAPALAEYLNRIGIELQPGWRVEINLSACEWMREAAQRLRRGFIIVIDYGHEALELYSASHSSGTLTAFHRHRSAGPESPGLPSW